MEATATATREAPEQPTEAPVVAQAEMSPERLFKWSQWVHVGAGAEECPERFTGKCQDEDHFHAWCRMPNQFQQRDIAEKARAAKARKLRLLKDGDSDSFVILEATLDEVRETGDKEGLIEEIVERQFTVDFEEALRRVESEDEFENHDQDAEEFRRLSALPEDQRGGEEYAALQKQMERYAERANEVLKELREPRYEAMRQRTMDELIEMVRKDRIDSAGNEAYLHTYNYWQWYVGTLKPAGVKDDGTPIRPLDRAFKDITDLKVNASPEVIDALKAAYEALEVSLTKGRAAGNS